MRGMVHVMLAAAAATVAPCLLAADRYETTARVVAVTPVVTRAVERMPVEQCTLELAPESLRGAGDRRRFRRCRTLEQLRERSRVEAFRVTYELAGETFHARLPRDPGDEVRVAVSVRPAR